jgi:hypothetical protein
LIFNRLHSVKFAVHGFSRPEPSTTRPPLRLIQFYYSLNFTAGRQARSNRVAYIRADSQTMYREWQLRAALAWTAALWWLSLRDSGTAYSSCAYGLFGR